jgi:hypothetical protein
MAFFHALVFWLRRQGIFWILALPIAGLAAALTYFVEMRHDLAEWRGHWGWIVLFAAIYTLFLDRWIKEALIDGADSCEGVDQLRHALVSWRFVAFAALLVAAGMALTEVPVAGAGPAIWVVLAVPFALMLPSFSAGEPLSPAAALRLGAPVFLTLLLTIGVATLVATLALYGMSWVRPMLPAKVWAPAALTAAMVLVDCLALAFVGHILAMLFRERSGWQPPEPEERPYREMRWRKA